LTEQPVWVKVGYQVTYYPYDREHHKTDFGHEAGLMQPLQKLADSECGHRRFSAGAGDEAGDGVLLAQRQILCGSDWSR
jgi:hypothetical protein